MTGKSFLYVFNIPIILGLQHRVEVPDRLLFFDNFFERGSHAVLPASLFWKAAEAETIISPAAIIGVPPFVPQTENDAVARLDTQPRAHRQLFLSVSRMVEIDIKFFDERQAQSATVQVDATRCIADVDDVIVEFFFKPDPDPQFA